MKHPAKGKMQPERPRATPPQARASQSPSAVKRWGVLGLCLVVACASTWALMEYVVWNTLPPELVGKWVVQGGEQDGATFDFYRNGTMVGRINLRGQEGIIHARVAVEGEKLLITTRNPRTGRDETKTQTIKLLTDQHLELVDEQQTTFRMDRVGR